MILVPVAWINKKKGHDSLKLTDLFWLVLSGIFLCFHFASWITSLEYTSVASSVVLVSTSPLWVALFAPLLLKEYLARMIWIGLLMAMIGGILVGGGQACQITQTGLQCKDLPSLLQGRSLWGNFLALVGAWCVTGYLLIGRRVRQKISIFTYTAVVYSTAAIGLFLLTVFTSTPLLGYSIETMSWIALLALIPQLIGHSTYNWALRYLSSTLVAVGTLGEPIGSVILALLILREPPTILEIVGGFLILSGIYWVSRFNRTPA